MGAMFLRSLAIFWALFIAAAAAANPVATGADPHVAIVGREYWIYPTGSPDPADKGRNLFYAYRSPDLQRWTRVGPILDMEAIDWVDDDGAPRHHLWAPALIEANGRFYFYYSVGPQNPTPSRIGVAIGDSPAGPFTDTGKPLLSGGGEGFEAIDPMVFRDSKSGDAYLYAGGSDGATLRVFKLASNMVEIEREIAVDQPPHFTEGAFMHERGGTYYLSYSHGRWNDASYSVHYATAPGPLGPWRYRGRILATNGRHKGPGHHSFVEGPGGASYIVYHRWQGVEGDGPYRGQRVIAIDRVFYAPDGSILPIASTDATPPAAPIPAQ